MSGSLGHLNWRVWTLWPAYVLVFLMLVFPMVHELLYAKAFLFAATLAITGAAMLKTGRAWLHPAVALWTLSLSVLAFVFVLEGFFAGAPGAGKAALVYVVWPILYAVVITGIRSERILFRVIGAVIVSVSCIGVYSIVYLLIATNILPENRYFDLISFDWQAQAFGLHEGYIGMQFPGVDSLPFLLPFTVAALTTYLPLNGRTPPLRRIWLWTAALFGLACVLVSGRRALFVVAIMSPLLTLLFQSFQPTAERRGSRKILLRVTAMVFVVVLASLLCLKAVYGIRMAGIVDRFSVGFDFSPTSEDEGAIVRGQQARALVAGWMENPLLGAGHGAPAFGSIRSELTPWNYELHYFALLYQTGIIGIGAYGASIFWIYWKGAQVIQSGGYLSALMVACLVGMTSVLIANATNPYLARFDGMWAIFLPLALINFWLMRRADLKFNMRLVRREADIYKCL
jgi:hypothetical protein